MVTIYYIGIPVTFAIILALIIFANKGLDDRNAGKHPLLRDSPIEASPSNVMFWVALSAVWPVFVPLFLLSFVCHVLIEVFSNN